jgi:hypothetical protein
MKHLRHLRVKTTVETFHVVDLDEDGPDPNTPDGLRAVLGVVAKDVEARSGFEPREVRYSHDGDTWHDAG